MTSSSNLLSEQPNGVMAKFSDNNLGAVNRLIVQWQSTFNFENTGGLAMFVPDLPPEVPPQETPVMMVVSHVDGGKHRTVGKCRVVENLTHGKDDLDNGLDPTSDVGFYFECLRALK